MKNDHRIALNPTEKKTLTRQNNAWMNHLQTAAVDIDSRSDAKITLTCAFCAKDDREDVRARATVERNRPESNAAGIQDTGTGYYSEERKTLVRAAIPYVWIHNCADARKRIAPAYRKAVTIDDFATFEGESGLEASKNKLLDVTNARSLTQRQSDVWFLPFGTDPEQVFNTIVDRLEMSEEKLLVIEQMRLGLSYRQIFGEDHKNAGIPIRAEFVRRARAIIDREIRPNYEDLKINHAVTEWPETSWQLTSNGWEIIERGERPEIKVPYTLPADYWEPKRYVLLTHALLTARWTRKAHNFDFFSGEPEPEIKSWTLRDKRGKDEQGRFKTQWTEFPLLENAATIAESLRARNFIWNPPAINIESFGDQLGKPAWYLDFAFPSFEYDRGKPYPNCMGFHVKQGVKTYKDKPTPTRGLDTKQLALAESIKWDNWARQIVIEQMLGEDRPLTSGLELASALGFTVQEYGGFAWRTFVHIVNNREDLRQIDFPLENRNGRREPQFRGVAYDPLFGFLQVFSPIMWIFEGVPFWEYDRLYRKIRSQRKAGNCFTAPVSPDLYIFRAPTTRRENADAEIIIPSTARPEYAAADLENYFNACTDARRQARSKLFLQFLAETYYPSDLWEFRAAERYF